MDDIDWSEWIPFSEAVASAPRESGVYMAREGETGEIVYIGMAGERSGSGKPQGIRGRLASYASGKGLVSGLGEAVLDRALADADWVKERLVELDTKGSRRAKQWGVEAFVRADLHIRWTTTEDKAAAVILEDRLVRSANGTLWNRASARLVGRETVGAPDGIVGSLPTAPNVDGVRRNESPSAIWLLVRSVSLLPTRGCSRRNVHNSSSFFAVRQSLVGGTRGSAQTDSGPVGFGHHEKFCFVSSRQRNG